MDTAVTPAETKKLESIQKGIDVPLSIGECARLGCAIKEDKSCPGVKTNYNEQVQTVHWACDCGHYGQTVCIDKSE